MIVNKSYALIIDEASSLIIIYKKTYLRHQSLDSAVDKMIFLKKLTSLKMFDKNKKIICRKNLIVQYKNVAIDK